MNVPEFPEKPIPAQAVKPFSSASGDSRVAASHQTDVTGRMIRSRFALLVVLIMVVLADMTVYHACGFTGPAVYLIAASVLLLIGIPGR